MTRLIDGLEEDGLVRRVPSSEDRRSIFVELTPAGLELCRRLIPAVARYSVEVCEGMSVADQKQFVNLLKSIAVNSEAFKGLE
jgi:DNA-binding MarR family transcriptional regulator